MFFAGENFKQASILQQLEVLISQQPEVVISSSGPALVSKPKSDGFHNVGDTSRDVRDSR